MLEVRLSRQAERAYRRVDVATRRRLDAAFEKLERGELDLPAIRALRGPLTGSFRYRIGPWRVVFSVDRDAGVLWVEAITTRGGAYR